MKWRRANRALHRDIGYFFLGMVIIYSLSGIALNHIDHWDPSYVIRNEKILIESGTVRRDMTRDEVKSLLKALNIGESLKDFYFPGDRTMKIFVKSGSITIDLMENTGIYESVKRRQVFFQFNYLHYNNPKFLWTYFADVFAGGLILMALTGIFMMQGKRSLSGRGKWFVATSLLIPLIFLLFYLW